MQIAQIGPRIVDARARSHSVSPRQARIHHLQQARVLQRRSDAFLVCQLAVHRSLRRVASGRKLDVHLHCVGQVEPRGKTERLAEHWRRAIRVLLLSVRWQHQCAGNMPVSVHSMCHARDLTLNRGGSTRSSLTRMQRPIRVAMLQCSTVGVNSTLLHRGVGLVRGMSYGMKRQRTTTHTLPRSPQASDGNHHHTHRTTPPASSTAMASSATTFNSSREYGCSGSLMSRICW